MSGLTIRQPGYLTDRRRQLATPNLRFQLDKTNLPHYPVARGNAPAFLLNKVLVKYAFFPTLSNLAYRLRSNGAILLPGSSGQHSCMLIKLRVCSNFDDESKARKFCFRRGEFCSRMRAIRRKIQRNRKQNLPLGAH